MVKCILTNSLKKNIKHLLADYQFSSFLKSRLYDYFLLNPSIRIITRDYCAKQLNIKSPIGVVR